MDINRLQTLGRQLAVFHCGCSNQQNRYNVIKCVTIQRSHLSRPWRSGNTTMSIPNRSLNVFRGLCQGRIGAVISRIWLGAIGQAIT